MTTPTKEQIEALAHRMCRTYKHGADEPYQFDGYTLHAFALKVLAEKELEVLKLREALEDIIDPIGAMQRDLEDGYQLHGAMALAIVKDPEHYKMIAKAALSTQTSTEALDEYVAARMTESDDRRDAERLDWLDRQNETLDRDTWVVLGHDCTAEDDYRKYWVGADLRKAIDAAIEAEKVRTE